MDVRKSQMPLTDSIAMDAFIEPVPPSELADAVEIARLEADVPVEAATDTATEAEQSFAGPSLRQAILDRLEESVEAGPQSVSQLLAALPAGTSRNTCENAIKRAFRAGEIERTSPGLYMLAKPKPAARLISSVNARLKVTMGPAGMPFRRRASNTAARTACSPSNA
jgi:hypothetical protein